MVLVAPNGSRHREILHELRELPDGQDQQSTQARTTAQSPHTDETLAIYRNGLCRTIPRMRRVRLPMGDNMSTNQPGAPYTNHGSTSAI